MNKREISQITRTAGGSTLTRNGRETTLNQISSALRTELNIQIKSFASLKVAHVEHLVELWKSRGLSLRSGQNNMAHLRAALREVGREKFATDPRLSNHSLGLAGASRAGTHTSIPRVEATRRIEQMRPGLKEAARLQLDLGLRAREAIQSQPSLKSWEKELSRTGFITVIHGTKGGRPRTVDLRSPEAHKAALEAITAARSIGGHLSPSTSLEGASRAYQREMAKAGFAGDEASHSLRYTWTREQFARHMEATGGDRAEALARTSLDLGHGDGRGRYVETTYLK